MTELEETGLAPRSASSQGELWRRIGSAAVLAPAVLALAWLGGIPFQLLCFAAAVILLIEWNAVAREGVRDLAIALAVSALLVSLLAFDLLGPTASVAALLAGALGSALAEGGESRGPPWAALGLLYSGSLLVSGLLLRADAALGFSAVLWVLVAVWASDTGAYAAGRAIGGPKLWPRVSPKKTWAGLAGGSAAALLLGGFVAHSAGVALLPAVILSAALGFAAQAGDLVESAFKRRFRVKDASRLIPGHGGLMDRIDSLVAALLVAAVVGLARGGTAAEGLLLW